MVKNSKLYIYRFKPRAPDLIILFMVLLLLLASLIIIYSVTMHYGFSEPNIKTSPFFKKQLIRIFLGSLFLLLATYFPYYYFQSVKLKKINLYDALLLLNVLLLLFTLIFGKKVGVVRRWILFFQPSEFLKITLTTWLSAYFANLQEKQVNYNFLESRIVNTFNNLRIYLFPLVVIFSITLLILLQPAVGSAIITASSGLAVAFIGGIRKRYLVFITMIIFFTFALAILTIPYARKRICYFSYQQKQAKIAIGSGGITGKGLGEGKQKLYFLPKAHTDFIYSAFAEELGFLGSVVLITIFLILFNRTVKLTLSINDYFARFLSIGIITAIIVYFIFHLAVNLVIIPTTGQPLPFISYGGSSLISNLIGIGIILNISRYGSFNRAIKK
jgi:cell division protein FtsW